jgi:hypothetical protein
MIEESRFLCEKCNESFEDKLECLVHEKTCSIVEKRWCFKCGKEESWNIDDDWAFTNSEGWHNISLGQVGYGSMLDGSYVNFVICDDCLYEFIKTFNIEGQEKIFNSGSNYRFDSDIWIKAKLGDLTDEEYEEYGMYSPRQINTYKERFPKCNKVNIVKYKDGSSGSRCEFGAFGDDDGGFSTNISENCFECDFFAEREDGEEIKIEYK